MKNNDIAKYIKKHRGKLPKGTYQRDKKDIRRELLDNYDNIVSSINSLVIDLRELIGNFDPLFLLIFSYIDEFFNNVLCKTESDLSESAIISTRIKEYVQAILVSQKNEKKGKDQSSSKFPEIKEIYKSLHYQILIDFTFSHSIKLGQNYNEERNIIEELCFKQIGHMYTVRNKRYQIHYEDFLRIMFTSYDSIFKEIYKISANDFIKGCINIYNSLMIEVPQFLSGIFFDTNRKNDFAKNMDQSVPETTFSNDYDISSNLVYQKLIKYFDIQLLTKWPIDLIKDLSWSLGEYELYLKNPNFPGWPILHSPLKQKPFININEKYYCNDFSNLMDNIYGIIKSLIIKKYPRFIDRWKEIQKGITENSSVDLISKILPDSHYYINSFYQSPPSKSLKPNWCEIDGIIEYDDTLILIETKSGSFTYLPPSLNFNAHLQSLKDLIVKPALQVTRFYDQLTKSKFVDIYSSKKDNFIKHINSNDYSDIFCICTTLESIPHITTDVRKLNKLFPNISILPVMHISLDDLRIYADIFDQPLQFIHFLKQRKKAYFEQKFNSFDEMDHLCLYLKYNCYSMVFHDLPDKTFFREIDLQDELDLYYSALMKEPENARKPQQIMPEFFKKILSILNNKTKKGKALVASSILSFDHDFRYELENIVQTNLKLNEKHGRAIPLDFKTDYNFYIQFSTPKMSKLEQWQLEEMLFEQLILAKNETSIAIDLFFNENYELIDIDYLIRTRDQIPPGKYKEYERRAITKAHNRVNKHLIECKNKKIGRNETCPCGSGKKYKKCHGR